MTALPDVPPRHTDCDGCGRLRRDLEQMSKRFKSLLVDFENLQVDLTIKRREVTTLRNEVAKRDRQDPVNQALHHESEAVFAYWKLRCRPGARVFGDKRRKAVLARLRDGYTPVDMCHGIDGACEDAFVDSKGKRHDDLELICRDEVKLDSFIQRAYAHEVRQLELFGMTPHWHPDGCVPADEPSNVIHLDERRAA